MHWNFWNQPYSYCFSFLQHLMYSAFEAWGKFIFKNGLFSYWYPGNSNFWRYDLIWASSVNLSTSPLPGTATLYWKEPSQDWHLRGLLDLCVALLETVSAEMSTEQGHCQLSYFIVAKWTGAKIVSPVLSNRASISVPLLQSTWYITGNQQERAWAVASAAKW